jgi:hypothetical protein
MARSQFIVAVSVITAATRADAFIAHLPAKMGPEPWSIARLFDILYSGDVLRLQATWHEMSALCASEGHSVPTPCKNGSNLRLSGRSSINSRRDFAFAMVLHAENHGTVDAFEQAYSSIRHYHPSNSIVVVDNKSPLQLSARVLDFLQKDPNALYVREAPSGFEIGGYRAALQAAQQNGWDVHGWVFLHATMVLLRPLPLGSLPCKVTSWYPYVHPDPIKVPCNLPESDAATYWAFRRDVKPSLDVNYTNELAEQEFQRLKREFPSWRQAEGRVCGRVNTPSAQHQSFAATVEGVRGLEDLGFFSFHPVQKEHSLFMEAFNGIFLAALDSSSPSCFIDQERAMLGGSGPCSIKGEPCPGTYIYKQHGEAEGWHQGFFRYFRQPHQLAGHQRRPGSGRRGVRAGEGKQACAVSPSPRRLVRCLGKGGPV